MEHDELCFKTATQLGRLLRDKKISSVELTKIFLGRLERLGPKYNALAELTPDLSLAQARRADRALGRGEAEAPSLLTGVPYGAKDLLATRNIPTRWGAPPYRNHVFDYDATVVQRLHSVGAVLVGKLAMVEMAGGGGYQYASASLHGPGLNPWNVKHWSGGSSSGSGSAVAAGLVPYALGSETWGSIVVPSAFCGITGLRPTWGLVGRYGAMELSWSMDKIGPMAHSAEDCGWVLQAIAGEDPQDPSTFFARSGFKFKPRISHSDFSLGVLPSDFSGEPEIEKAFGDALKVLRKAGLKITEVELPKLPYAQIASTILGSEAAAAHEKFIRSKKLNGLVDAGQKKGLRKYLEIRAASYLRAMRERDSAQSQVLGVLNKFDALVSPSLMVEAPAITANLKTALRKGGGYSVLGSLFGLPSLSLPMGFGRKGLPFGLSLTGRILDEDTLLHIGMIYQRETDWHRAKPPME